MTKFEKLCREVASATGIDVDFYEDRRPADVFEDDGTLHVMYRGLRAVFDVGSGQSLTGEEQNTRTRLILEKLDRPVTDRVLVEEYEDDDEETDCN